MVAVTMTPQQFAAKRAELMEKLGVSMDPPTPGGSAEGTISHEGFVVSYRYDPHTKQMTALFTKKPLLVAKAIAEAKLRSWLTT